MKQTVTIEIIDSTVLQLLRNLASMNLVRFTQETNKEDELITARLNEVYNDEESSLDPCLMVAQTEAIDRENW
ncbi:MAG: hypothetical protein FWF38_00175 [Spirochaetaceae bacterium]|nr:hypothetical protein [Spirochaetaceae bacterium]